MLFWKRTFPLCCAIGATSLVLAVYTVGTILLVLNKEESVKSDLSSIQASIADMSLAAVRNAVMSSDYEEDLLSSDELRGLSQYSFLQGVSIKDSDGSSLEFAELTPAESSSRYQVARVEESIIDPFGRELTIIAYIDDIYSGVAFGVPKEWLVAGSVWCLLALIVFYAFRVRRGSYFEASTGGGWLGKSRNDWEEKSLALNMVENLVLRGLLDPINRAKDSLDSGHEAIQSGLIEEARIQIQFALDDINLMSHSFKGVTAFSDGEKEKGKQWIPANDLFEEVNAELLSLASESKVDFSFSSMLPDNLEIFAVPQVVSVIFSTAVGETIKEVRGGSLSIIVTHSKTTMVFNVHVSDGNRTVDIESEDAIKKIQSLLFLTKSLGGSALIHSSESQSVQIEVKLPAVLRIEGESGIESINSEAKMSVPKKVVRGHCDYDTFYQNVGEGGVKVLLIDSDIERLRETSLLMNKEDLRREDVRVYCTSDPSEALGHIEETNFSAVILNQDSVKISPIELFKFVDQCRGGGCVKILTRIDTSLPLPTALEELGVEAFKDNLSLSDLKTVLRSASVKPVSLQDGAN